MQEEDVTDPKADTDLEGFPQVGAGDELTLARQEIERLRAKLEDGVEERLSWGPTPFLDAVAISRNFTGAAFMRTFDLTAAAEEEIERLVSKLGLSELHAEAFRLAAEGYRLTAEAMTPLVKSVDDQTSFRTPDNVNGVRGFKVFLDEAAVADAVKAMKASSTGQ